jgi:hypothetical protein
MGKVYETISDEQAAWIKAQRIFFVATDEMSEQSTDGLPAFDLPRWRRQPTGDADQ